MLDLLTSTAALFVVVSLLGLAGLGLTVVPFVQATEIAERRHLSTVRAGVLTFAGVGAGLLGALVVYRSSAPRALSLVPLLLCGLGPALVRLLPAGVLTGRPGAHE